MAARQHGVISRRQLIEVGFGEEAIEHRLATGRLHRILPGVYAVGWPEVTDERSWMAAVLGCEPNAALSHHSAAALWGFGRERRGRVDVSVRRRCEHRLPGIHARSRPTLPAGDIVEHRGIPTTRPARTLLDQAAELDPRALERAVNDADKLDLVTPDELREELEAFRGQPGIRPLRALLDRHVLLLSDSELEVLFRPIAVSAGLPRPQTKVRVNGFEVDFFWPGLGLVVETDGLRYHRTPFAQARLGGGSE